MDAGEGHEGACHPAARSMLSTTVRVPMLVIAGANTTAIRDRAFLVLTDYPLDAHLDASNATSQPTWRPLPSGDSSTN
jgi:hypothetical protein